MDQGHWGTMGPSRDKGDHSVYSRENLGQVRHKVMYMIQVLILDEATR